MKPIHMVRAGLVSILLAATLALTAVWTGDSRWGDSAVVFVILAMVGVIGGGVAALAVEEVRKDPK